MAPSAISDTQAYVLLTREGKNVKSVETEADHVHGAQDKTPLEAISHGPLIQPGEANLSLVHHAII